MVERSTIETAKSVTGKNIQLTVKQWLHIIESHDYMAGNMDKIIETVNVPDCIVRGIQGEKIALKHYPQTNITDKHCVVVYQEDKTGFIITAFMTSKPETLKKRGVIWQK